MLKRRLKAERRKQQYAYATEQAKSAGAMSVITTTASACCAGDKKSHPHAPGKQEIQPVTMVVRDLRYFVPNPAYSASENRKRRNSAAGGGQEAAEELPKELELLKGQ